MQAFSILNKSLTTALYLTDPKEWQIKRTHLRSKQKILKNQSLQKSTSEPHLTLALRQVGRAPAGWKRKNLEKKDTKIFSRYRGNWTKGKSHGVGNTSVLALFGTSPKVDETGF